MYEPKFYLQLGSDEPVLLSIEELGNLAGGVWLVRPLPALLEKNEEGDDDPETN